MDDFPSHAHEPACSAAVAKLSGVVVHLSVLMLEGILYAFGFSPVSTEIGAPFVAAILRSFASQETPSVAVLQALNEELTQGLSSDPAASAGPQPLGPRTSETIAASALIEPPAPSPADSALPCISDQHAFEASWRLPSEIDPAYPPAADLSSIFGRVDFYRDLATTWQSANRQFWERSSPLEGFNQIARSLVTRATELQRENAVLKARLQELEPPVTSSAPPEPSLGSLDAYLRALGESAASARSISHAAFDKLQKLEAALKTSESSLASEEDRHQAAVSELKDKEAELLSQSADVSLLRQSRELLQMGLADAQALASAAASREAQEAVSQGQSDLSVARAEVAENKNSLEAYRAGESERLKAYRLAYVRSTFFLQKLGRWMVLLMCHGAAGGVRQAFEQASPNPYRGRPAAFRSTPIPAEEDSPGDRHDPVPTEPVPEPSPAPPGADTGPSQPSSSARHHYRTTISSEAALARRHDVPTSLLIMKGCLGSLWAESMSQMYSASPLSQMDRFSKSWVKTHAESLVLNQSFHALHHESKELRERVSELELQLNDPAQASYALRAEIQALTNQTNRQKSSLVQVKDELRAMREERTASEAGYQQQLAHQAQEIQSKDTLLQEKNKKLEAQAAQLETQAAELGALKAELSQSRAALTGVSTALAVYQEGEEDRCLQSRISYLTSPEFLSQTGARFSATIPYTAAGVIRQLHARSFLNSIPPADFLDPEKIIQGFPDEIFAPFK
ncbi:uncharacterized protein LOC121995460 [Zingiber officinale]|uniref:uncharacterized protein LOC121995460 n=1 Tax=Zingiber officinale TaxID=94328 RepID=UPI001C4BE82B|nr:uncharacterized protein LOC121995460 [Zingiber officinale]